MVSYKALNTAPKSINPLPILLNVTEVNNAIFFSNILIVN